MVVSLDRSDHLRSDRGHRLFERKFALVERGADDDCGRTSLPQRLDVVNVGDAAAGDNRNLDTLTDPADEIGVDTGELPLNVDISQ